MGQQLPARQGQRARRREVIAKAINAQASAIVTVEQRRQQTEARVAMLEAALEDFYSRTLLQRVKLLVLGR